MTRIPLLRTLIRGHDEESERETITSLNTSDREEEDDETEKRKIPFCYQ